jgi:GT2 family glycosyltransferase
MISVLIPTYNRKEWLKHTLNCIAKQTYTDFEVIVVDASQPADQLSDREVSENKFPFQYIRYGISGNVSLQRNKAIQNSKGDLLLFVDDDVDFDEKLFLNYATIFADKKYDAISGLVETPKVKRTNKPVFFKGNRFTDFGLPNYQPCDFEIETYVICTANFCFRRSVYEQYGGFDEKIFGVFDDVDYGFKLKSCGVKVYHHPDVFLFHYQAKMSGARSSSIPSWWFYYNACYFHFKNLKPNRFTFWLDCSWTLLKPSSIWLNPFKQFTRYRDFITGFTNAKKTLKLIS